MRHLDPNNISRRALARAKKDSYEKLALRIESEYNNTFSWRRRARYSDGTVPVGDDDTLIELEKPIAIGWTRSFVVKEEALRTPLGQLVKSVLPLVNSKVFSRKTRDFSYMKLEYNDEKKTTVDRRQYPKALEEKEYLTLTDEQKRLFVEHQDPVQLTNSVVYRKTYFLKDWRRLLRFKTEKEFVTHMRLPKSEAESLRDRYNNKYYNSGWIFRWSPRYKGYSDYERKYSRSRSKRDFVEELRLEDEPFFEEDYDLYYDDSRYEDWWDYEEKMIFNRYNPYEDHDFIF